MLDANRILKVVDAAVDKKIGSNIDITYGQVYGIVGNYASVYLAGSRELAVSAGDVPEPSDGFRIPAGLGIAALDFVRVSLDKRGHRWIDEVLPNLDYPKLALDPNRGTLLISDGFSPPALGTPGQVPTVDPSGIGMAWSQPSDLITIPFVINGVTGTVSNAEIPLIDAANPAAAPRINIPWKFEVVGISVRTSTVRSGGTLTVTPRISGVACNFSAQLNGTDTTGAYGTGLETAATNQGAGGNDVGVVYTSSAWTPTATYIYGSIFVLMHRPAIVLVTTVASFTANAVIKVAPAVTGAFTANAALIAPTSSGSFTADAILKKTTASTFTADAVLVPQPTPPSGLSGQLGTPDSDLGEIVLGKG